MTSRRDSGRSDDRRSRSGSARSDGHPSPTRDRESHDRTEGVGARPTAESAAAGVRAQASLRQLPPIDRLLAVADDLIRQHGRATVTEALRAVVATARDRARDGQQVPSTPALLVAADEWIARRRPPQLQPVVNATGVVIHTNLGRAPLAPAARDAMVEAAGYCDLEYDLPTGGRGTRTARLEPLLCDATGADAAFAVNNAAAALVLTLAALAAGRDVLVSRGELIEIGGSFRLPDIMGASGARLVEVGTTNRTRAHDFMAGDEPGAILALHPSNYRIVGFVEQASLADLSAVAAKRQVPLIYDTGSGLLQRARGALADEPAVADALGDGADIVLCSADKLLGGPQAGLLFGRADLIERCRRHPLARAMRLDKLRIAALHATLMLHLADRRHDVPVWRMLQADDAELHARSRRLAAGLTAAGVSAAVVEEAGLPGGGAAPDVALAGPVVRVDITRPSQAAARLRAQRPPIVVRVADDALYVDLRTVATDHDDLIARRVAALAAHVDR